jgi:hypothetical protein
MPLMLNLEKREGERESREREEERTRGMGVLSNAEHNVNDYTDAPSVSAASYAAGDMMTERVGRDSLGLGCESARVGKRRRKTER